MRWKGAAGATFWKGVFVLSFVLFSGSTETWR